MTEKLVHGIWPALCTAFDDSGDSVDGERQRNLVGRLIDSGIQGFFVCGGTGEGMAMSLPERMKVTEVVAHEAAGAVRLILQVGGTSTENGIKLAQHAARIPGIDGIASVAPVDAPNNLEAATAHYSAIGAASDLPFFVYWLSQEADKTATADNFLNAMQNVPNFSGVKFTDNDLYLFGQLVDLSDGKLNAISGPDQMALPAMTMGSDAAIGTTYNIMPEIFLKMRRCFEEGNISAAQECQTNANRVIRILIEVGVLPGVKQLLADRNIPVGPTRIVSPLDKHEIETLHSKLAQLEFDVQ